MGDKGKDNECIQVVVRCRPFNKKEKDQGYHFNYYQLLSIIINYYQLLSIIINHYYYYYYQ